MKKIILILMIFGFSISCGKKSNIISPDDANIFKADFVIAESQGVKIRNQDLGPGFLAHIEGIKTKLIQQQVKAAKRALQAKTKGKANKKNTTFYVNYIPQRVKIDIFDDDPQKGSKDALITLIEFTDYECPFCYRVSPTLTKVMEAHPGKIRRIMKDFPLGFHKKAIKAAEAAHCVWDIDKTKYWEYQSKLFKSKVVERKKQLGIPYLKDYAIDLGIPIGKFSQCLKSGKFSDKVKQGMALGRKAGVNGTPAVFINGVLVSGALPFSAFNAIIEDELSEIESK